MTTAFHLMIVKSKDVSWCKTRHTHTILPSHFLVQLLLDKNGGGKHREAMGTFENFSGCLLTRGFFCRM